MTMTAVFPNGFTARLFIIRSPFHLFRAHADNFFYFDEQGERNHICTHSVENWARINGVQVYGTKSSHVEHHPEMDHQYQAHQSNANGMVFQIRKRVRPNDSN